jgi:hypothetical protein
MRHAKLAGVIAVLTATTTSAMGDPPAINTDEDDAHADCPQAVRGVDVSRKSIDGGVSFKFTTHDKAQLDDLRVLLREAATLIEHHSKLAALHPEQMQVNADAFVIPAVDIDVKDTPMGAQITVRAEDPTQLGEVRAQAIAFEEFWDRSTCIHGKTAGKKIELQQVSK